MGHFNKLFNEKNLKAETILKENLKLRKIQNYIDYHHGCSVNYFPGEDLRNCTSLRNLCIRQLHVKLCYRLKVERGNYFISYLNTPVVIDLLCIPETLKKDLLETLQSCPIHHNLIVCVSGKPKRSVYRLKENSFLYNKIKQSADNTLLHRHLTIKNMFDILNEFNLHNYIQRNYRTIFNFMEQNSVHLKISDLI